MVVLAPGAIEVEGADNIGAIRLYFTSSFLPVSGFFSPEDVVIDLLYSCNYTCLVTRHYRSLLIWA